MAGASVLTDIRSMIDLAIGTPEVGVVDFCMLHTVLHCLAQQLNALDRPVELLGGATPQAVPAGKDTHTVAITEYIVETDTAAPMKPKAVKPPPPPAESTLLVVERVKKDSSPFPSADPTGLKARPDGPAAGKTRSKSASEGHEEGLREEEGGHEEVGIAEESRHTEPRQMTSSEKLSLVTLSKFNLLENAVQDLKDRVYGSMPKNEQILEEVRSQTNMKAITDMWTNLNVSSRLEAAETGLAKLSSLVEDLIKEGGTRPGALSAALEAAAATGTSPTTLAIPSQTDQLQDRQIKQLGPASPLDAFAAETAHDRDMMLHQLSRLRADIDLLNKTFYDAMQSLQSNLDLKKQIPLPPPPQPAPVEELLPPRPPAFAAETAHDRDMMLHQLSRLRADIDLLNKTFYDAMQSLQSNLDLKKQIPLPPPPQPAPVEELLPPRPPAFAAETAHDRDMMLQQLNRLRADIDLLNKTFYDAMQSLQSNLDLKKQIPLPPPPQPAPVEELLPPRPPAFAAETAHDRDMMLHQLSRLRADIDLLNKTFYDAMQSLQSNLDLKKPIPLPPPPQPAPVEELLPPRPPAFAAETAHDRDMMLHQLSRLRADIDLLNKTFYDAMQSLQSNLDLKKPIPLPPPPQPAPVEELLPPRPPPSPFSSPGRPPTTTEARFTPASHGSTVMSAALTDRLAQLEHRIKECCESMGKDKGTVQDQLNNFQDQLDHLMRQVGALHEDLGVLKLSPNLAKDLEGLLELYQTVQDMQQQLHQVNEVARQLAGEKDDRHQHIKALLEQIEILKTIKMDREDMAEAMAEKADLRMLARKVSHDQFEMACDDLSRGLEHALGKLNTQEALWQQVLDDVQREIESKLDKMELSPLKEFFENKLRLLQDNLKQMASLRRNVEAAGTKRRLLREVNCISCDADAVMPLENTFAMPSKPLPAHLSMKPYLSYELDTIRKTQANNLPQRNLHDWETIEKQKAPKAPVKVRSDTDKHICNRYCGGSHTTTTPAQRVARTGHFIKQWGPDVVPLSSGLAAGDDGRLYKVTTTEHANVGPGGSVDPTCTKKTKSPEPSRTLPKAPVIILNKECRCLDGGP